MNYFDRRPSNKSVDYVEFFGFSGAQDSVRIVLADGSIEVMSSHKALKQRKVLFIDYFLCSHSTQWEPFEKILIRWIELLGGSVSQNRLNEMVSKMSERFKSGRYLSRSKYLGYYFGTEGGVFSSGATIYKDPHNGRKSIISRDDESNNRLSRLGLLPYCFRRRKE